MESIGENFKLMSQPKVKKDLTKALEEAEYGHESDSSFKSD